MTVDETLSETATQKALRALRAQSFFALLLVLVLAVVICLVSEVTLLALVCTLVGLQGPLALFFAHHFLARVTQ